MKYPFSKGANAISKVSLVLIFLVLIGALSFAMAYRQFPMATGEGAEIVQPIPFSHKHHVQGLGLDCRFCHNTVDKTSQAGYPDTATCFGCHSKIWNKAEMLKPVRESAANKTPLHWFRVNRLPDHVYFDHSIHVSKNIGCVSCHGEVSKMARVVQHRSFLMRDCLECHSAPEKYVRPHKELFNEAWNPLNQEEIGMQLIRHKNIKTPPTTNCSACHR